MRARTPIERAVDTYCNDWRKVRADQADFARVNPETLGNSTPQDFTFRYIDISSVTEGTIDWQAVNRIRFADSPSRARRVVRQGDTMICTVRPLLGSHAYANWTEAEPTVCSTGFAIVRCEGDTIPGFVKHLPFAEQVIRQFVAWQCGTNYPAVNERDIRRLLLPAPSPKEQIAIARILDAVDTAIERAREAEGRARLLQTSLLDDAFDRLEAGRKRLGEFTTDVRYGTSKAANERGWGNPTLRIPNVAGDQLRLEDLVYVDLKPVEVERLMLRDGDLVLVRTNGNPNYVGRSAVFKSPDDRIWIYASYLIRVRLNDDLLPDYVNIFLSLERGRRELLRRVTTSAGNHNINSNSIRLLSIPVPDSKAPQEHIIEIAKACRAHITATRHKLAALGELKNALMHDLLTGKVRVNNIGFEKSLT
jgi:type I restriction enzyme, S subunit